MALATLLSGMTVASAQQLPTKVSVSQDPPITVTTDSPFPLLEDGLLADKLTITVKPGAEVCVEDPLPYVTQRERWAFRNWSHGPEDTCVIFTEPGVYRAVFDKEFVVHIRSEVIGMNVSSWVVAGERIEVEVPEIVKGGESSRFRFQEWGEGESPFTSTNVVAALGPLDLVPVWVKEHFVQIEGPENANIQGSDWYPDGFTLPLRSPAVIQSEKEGERLIFASWESVGVRFVAISEPEIAVTTLVVNGPYTVSATYNKEYLVSARSPFGVLKQEWVKEGEGVELEAPSIQETVPGKQRFVFQRWTGQEGLTSPRILGVANQPITLTAVYERQYMITVESPYGASGGGWHAAGAQITLSVPQEVESKLIFKKKFQSFAGFPQGRSSIDLSTDGPRVITAVYSTKVNVGILALLLLIPLAAVVLFFANRWIFRLVRTPRRSIRRR